MAVEDDKTALEIQLLRRQIELKDKELELKDRELELKSKELTDLDKQKTWKVDPVVVGIAAALIGFLGNVVATYLQGRSSLDLERIKHEVSRALESDKFRSSLILEAIKTGDPEKAARNIEFFLEAGFVEDQSGKITKYLSEKSKIPVLPSAAPSIGAGEPLERLPQDDASRKFATAVGLLSIDGHGFCTGWLITREYVITADYCVTSFGEKFQHPILRMGFLSGRDAPTDYSIDPKPVEISEKFGYAILKVQGDPAAHFGTIPLRTREPIVGESLFILHHSEAKPMAITRDSQCRITKSQYDQETSFGHTCDTLGGSGGAPVIAASDLHILGVHHSGSRDGQSKLAKRLSAILKQSETLKRIIADSAPQKP